MRIENMAVGARKEKLGSVPMESVWQRVYRMINSNCLSRKHNFRRQWHHFLSIWKVKWNKKTIRVCNRITCNIDVSSRSNINKQQQQQ